jgi:hypothetical protein
MVKLIAKKGYVMVPKTFYTCPKCNYDLYMSEKEAKEHVAVPINKTLAPEGFCFLSKMLWFGHTYLTHLNIITKIRTSHIGKKADRFGGITNYHIGDRAPDHSIIQDSKVLLLEENCFDGTRSKGMRGENRGFMEKNVSYYEIMDEIAPKRLPRLEKIWHITQKQLEGFKEEYLKNKRSGHIFRDFSTEKWTCGREVLENLLK